MLRDLESIKPTNTPTRGADEADKPADKAQPAEAEAPAAKTSDEKQFRQAFRFKIILKKNQMK